MPAEHVVEFQSISKIYNRKYFSGKSTIAVKNVSFVLEAGETFCLIGPNGAGKTTLIRMLLDFTRPTEGCSFLFGRPNTIPLLRDRIGYFPERAQYPPYLNVNQFLIYWGKFSGLGGEQLTSKIDEVLRLVRLEEKKNVLLKDLSKGMAVRVGLSQALINDPQLLILDEPTDGLDPLGRIEFRDILIKLKQQGKTILMNSHLLSEVEQISTRVAILDKGEIAAIETLENLTSSSSGTVIEFSCELQGAISPLREKFRIEQRPEGWMLSLDDPAQLDEAVKELVRFGATIRNVHRPKSLLEQRFLSLVRPAE